MYQVLIIHSPQTLRMGEVSWQETRGLGLHRGCLGLLWSVSQQTERLYLGWWGLYGWFLIGLKKLLIGWGKDVQELLRVLFHEFDNVLPFPFGLSYRPEKSIPRLLNQGFLTYILPFNHLNYLKRFLSAYHPPFQLSTFAEYHLPSIFRPLNLLFRTSRPII